MKDFIKILSMVIFFATISCSEDTVDLETLGSLKGTVVKKGTNEPLENVKISTNPASSTVFTDENGKYQIDNLVSGNYSLSAERDDLLAEIEAISIISDKELEVVFEIDIKTSGNKPPNSAVLHLPADNAVDVSPLEAKLVWSGSDPENNELTYVISVRNQLNSEVQRIEAIKDTTYTLTNLSYDVKYTWQVSSSDNINKPVNSPISVFKTASPPGNRLFFTRIENGNSVIYSSDESGGTIIAVTSKFKNSFRPRRDIHARKVAFLRSVGSQVQLFTMDEDGSNERQVTSKVGVSGFNLEEIDFSWDSYGARLLFPNQDKLYSINADGSGLNLVYQTSDGNVITEIDKNDNSNTIALKTNNLQGYGVKIFTIDGGKTVTNTILKGDLKGAAGGINLSVDGTRILYSRDVSNSETGDYRILDSHLFVHNIVDGTTIDVSENKPSGTNDLDGRFSPNEADIIFVNTSNDGISVKNIQTMSIVGGVVRRTILKDSEMIDWE